MFRQSERFRSHFDMMTSTIFTYSIPEFTSGKEPEYASRISLDTKPLWSNIRSLGNGFLGVSYQETSPGFLFDQTGKKRWISVLILKLSRSILLPN